MGVVVDRELASCFPCKGVVTNEALQTLGPGVVVCRSMTPGSPGSAGSACSGTSNKIVLHLQWRAEGWTRYYPSWVGYQRYPIP